MSQYPLTPPDLALLIERILEHAKTASARQG
jgi:hypothetical protein